MLLKIVKSGAPISLVIAVWKDAFGSARIFTACFEPTGGPDTVLQTWAAVWQCRLENFGVRHRRLCRNKRLR
jgi:hypothetical protein